MASTETAILRGVANRHGKEPRDFNSWLEDFGEAFDDIIQGLTMPNTINDALYHRKKIMTLLFVRLFDSNTSVKAFDSKWQDLHEFCDTCVPSLSYHNFFESLSFLGLGAELTSIIQIVDVNIQKILGQHLFDWVKSKTEISESSAIDDVIVTLFIASLVTASRAKTRNDQLLVSTVKKCQEILFLVTNKSVIKDPPCTISNTYFKCMKLMFEAIEYDISSKTNDSDNITTPDILYLNRLKDTLKCGLSKNTLHQTITDLITLKSFQSTENRLTIGNSQVESCFYKFVEKSLHYLITTVSDATVKEICNSMKTMLDIDGSENELKKDFPTESSKWKNDIIVVTNCLDGYNKSTVRLLTSLVSNLIGNNNWKEIVVCFQSSPQCLAVKSNLLYILDIISRCTKLENCEMQLAELSAITSEFQKLFWKGFTLLTVKSKYDLTKEIIFGRKNYSLLSACTVKTNEKGTAMIERNTNDNKSKKAIRNFFEKLIDQDTLNDSIRAEFSHVCLLSPSLCLTSLVENAFCNRLDIFASLLLEWDYLLQFPYDYKHSKNQSCLFWSKFFECLKYRYIKEDGKSVDNGMALITWLFEKSSCESTLFHSLIKEGFTMFGNSISSCSQSDHVIMKLQLQVIDVFSKTELFKTIMSPEELLSLCITLCTKFDVSVSSWLTDPLCNENDDLLDDVFEAVFTIATEKIACLKSQNSDDFLLITKWLCHYANGFTWLIRLRFLPLLQHVDGFLLSVPACLADVCKMPTIFQPDTDLCYGKGNGLLAWQQCFIINSNICPIHSLAIECLEAHEIKMFTNAWIITLAQILPFCKTSQWLKLMETTKLLISDCKLYCPYQYTQLAWISNIHIPEVYNLLGVVQVIKGVFDALCNKELVEWFSKLSFASLSKRFSEVCSWLVSASPDFAKASLLSQAFILSQIFCSVCYVARLIRSVGNDQARSCLETLFILCLELLGTFEKIVPKLCENVGSSEENESSDDDASVSSSSYRFSHNSDLFCTKYHILEMSSRIEEMIQSSAIMYKKQTDILIRKLSMLNKGIDEIRIHAQKDCDLDDGI